MSRPAADRLLDIGLKAAALAAGLMLVWIVVFITTEALPVFDSVAPHRFLTDESWHPRDGRFGMLPMILGTLAVSLLAIAIAAPLGLVASVFQVFYAPAALRGLFRRMVELLAGIPSVVFGLWGLTALVPLLARIEPPGTSLLAAALVLAAMILPTMALFSGAALAAVPPAHIRAARALGLTRWRIVRSVALPMARSGIATGIFLALARALGETMAVLMVAGNVAAVPTGLLEPVRTLTANIALEMAYALGTHRQALFLSGLLVTAVTLALVFAAERLQAWRPRP